MLVSGPGLREDAVVIDELPLVLDHSQRVEVNGGLDKYNGCR